MDTLLDTLEEGRHSFLEISMFPDLLISSNPSLSANESLETTCFKGFCAIILLAFIMIWLLLTDDNGQFLILL